jgi:murein DD-endopeptidase MepM/ murein hydrolase activator NlpD
VALDIRRHAPVGRRRLPFLAGTGGNISARGRHGDIFSDAGTNKTSKGGSFRWIVSTTLAGAVGAISVAAVVFGSGDRRETETALRQILAGPSAMSAAAIRTVEPQDKGLKWAIPKTDRLQNMSEALLGRFLVHDTMRVKRGTRDVIVNKGFVRLVARLAPVSTYEAERVPPFNPYRLYAAPGSQDDGSSQNVSDDAQDIATRLTEAIGNALPTEDGQELDTAEVAEIVLRSLAVQDESVPAGSSIRGGFKAAGAGKATPQELLADRSLRAGLDRLPPNTTALTKTTADHDDAIEDLETRRVRVVKVTRGQTLTRILLENGGDRFQVRAMIEAAKAILPDSGLTPGMEAHVTVVPSLTRANVLEPARVSVFGEGQDHKLSIARNAAGEFVASATAISDRASQAAVGNDDQAATASLYTSFYHAALSHGLSDDTINQIMRIHAYETDFRRRVRGSDQVEWFFDAREDDKGLDTPLGDLLMTSITAGGETQRFYRFRSQDGVVDFYDENGDTSRKFLMRRPVRGEGMRLSSGFGMRQHPILRFVRPHNGVDWSGPTGTPIMAAGAGLIEEAGRKGEYGNYIRIQHSNGYKTSYAHMQRFAPGISDGVRVRQGQVIGYLGNTGLSSGPHLHYEVLINNRPVDPMSIQVPRDRKLTSNQLRDFQREKTRIEELLRRNPVSQRIVDQKTALRQ